MLGQRPLRRTYKLDNQPTKLVSNIHVTLLIGYDDDHYYYIDPLWSHIGKLIVFPALIPNKYQVIKLKTLVQSYDAPGRLSFIFSHNYFYFALSKMNHLSNSRIRRYYK